MARGNSAGWRPSACRWRNLLKLRLPGLPAELARPASKGSSCRRAALQDAKLLTLLGRKNEAVSSLQKAFMAREGQMIYLKCDRSWCSCAPIRIFKRSKKMNFPERALAPQQKSLIRRQVSTPQQIRCEKLTYCEAPHRSWTSAARSGSINALRPCKPEQTCTAVIPEAPRKSAPAKFAPSSSAPRKIAPVKYAPRRSAFFKLRGRQVRLLQTCKRQHRVLEFRIAHIRARKVGPQQLRIPHIHGIKRCPGNLCIRKHCIFKRAV